MIEESDLPSTTLVTLFHPALAHIKRKEDYYDQLTERRAIAGRLNDRLLELSPRDSILDPCGLDA